MIDYALQYAFRWILSYWISIHYNKEETGTKELVLKTLCTSCHKFKDRFILEV